MSIVEDALQCVLGQVVGGVSLALEPTGQDHRELQLRIVESSDWSDA